MNPLFSRQDVVDFFVHKDYPLSKEVAQLRALWADHRDLLDVAEGVRFEEFIRDIRRLMEKRAHAKADLNELEFLLQGLEFAPAFETEEEVLYIVERYFKMIKLSLLMPDGKGYRRVKLRSVLSAFHYKRRSRLLVNEIRQALLELDLVTCVRGGVSCDIADAAIDDMLTIRLAHTL